MSRLTRRLLIGSAVVVGIGAAASWLLMRHLSARGWHGPVTDHFDGERFHNLDPIEDKTFGDMMKWMRERDEREEWSWRDIGAPNVPARRIDGGGLRVTMVNHATLLLQTSGINLLTDPIWSKRTSPYQWIGPARFHPPGVRFEDLPPIDVVFVSHNHYDHMDLATLQRLSRERQPRIIAGLGNREFLERNGVERVTELDWFGSVELAPGVKLTAVPVQHWSTRTRMDLRKTLWMGFVLQTPAGNTYFPGDTGYAGHFKLVRERFGPMRLALLPIGAYLPRWFMKDSHTDPSDVILAHRELEARASVPMHYGTFQLGDDGQDQAIDELRRVLTERKVDGFHVLRPAQALDVP